MKNIMDNRIRFLKNLAELKNKEKENIEEYEWYSFLRDFNTESEAIEMKLEEDNILTVKKPVNTEDNHYEKEMLLYTVLHRIFSERKDKTVFIGNGIFTIKDEKKSIKYPMLIQPVYIEFDSIEGAFLLKGSGKSQLMTAPIPDELNRECLGEVIRRVTEESIFPCGNCATELFREMMNLLSARCDMYIIEDNPVLFYKDAGTNEYIDFLDVLQENNERGTVTKPFEILMGVCNNMADETEDNSTGGLVDLFDLNNEQKKAAHSMLGNHISVVSGPPGTGKTYTAASAACYAAQKGKSVLITTKNYKSLEAIRKKLPHKIESISLMLDKNNDSDIVSEKIDTILDYYNKFTPEDIEQKISAIEETLVLLENRLVSRNKSLKNMTSYEDADLTAGKELLDKKDLLPLIPDSLPENFRISISDIEKLYKTNVITKSEEELFNTNILESLPEPKVLNNIFLESRKTDTKLEELSKYFKLFTVDRWMMEAAIDGENGRFHRLLDILDKMFRARKVFMDEYPDVSINIDDGLSFEVIKQNFPIIHEDFEKKGRVAGKNICKSSIRKCLNGININGEGIKTKKDCNAVKAYLIWKISECYAQNLWDSSLVSYGVPDFTSASDRIKYQTMDSMSTAFEFPVQFKALKNILSKMEIDWRDFLCVNQYDTTLNELQKTIDSVDAIHNLYIEADEKKYNDRYEDLLKKTMNLTEELMKYDEGLGQKLFNDIDSGALEEYCNHYNDEVLKLLKKKDLEFERRKVLLKRLSMGAPEFAGKISRREGELYSSAEIPEEITGAFKGKQIITKLEERNMEHLQLQTLIKNDRTLILQNRQDLIFWRIMYHTIKKLNADHKNYEELMAFQMTFQRIGKGTGKRVKSLKIALAESYKKIQRILPIWLAPASLVYEYMNPGTFNYMIVDEASECDILCSALASLSDHMLVIGDEQQSESITIGTSDEQIRIIQQGYLDDVSNNHLYNFNMSLFDLAKMQSGKKEQMLLEHYRCHPSIIAFSNELSYKGKLLPMKSPFQNLEPIVGIKVSGKKSGKKNYMEAEVIVSMIDKIIKDADYDGKTIGIISLVGKEQARLIERLLLQNIDLDEMIKRDILIGNSVDFQGAERDIVLISCVDAPEYEDEVLALKTEGNNSWFKKRLNVAFSRAKEQTIVFHSFAQGNLQSKDIRQRILSHINKGNKYNVDDSLELSAFEIDVYNYLSKEESVQCLKGLEIGKYVIPITVRYADKTIIVNCKEFDDEYYMLLERAGYEVQTICPADFYMSVINNKNILA